MLGLEIEVHAAKLAAIFDPRPVSTEELVPSARISPSVLRNSAQAADDGRVMAAARDLDAIRHTVETLTAEIGRIVAERQDLRAAGAGPAALEENRRRLAAAQSQLSLLLIERHLPAVRSA
jgi:hypothetical protein